MPIQKDLIFFVETSCAFAVIKVESIPPLKKVPTSTSANICFFTISDNLLSKIFTDLIGLILM